MPHQEGVHVTWIDAEIRLSSTQGTPIREVDVESAAIREFHPLDYCVRGLEGG